MSVENADRSPSIAGAKSSWRAMRTRCYNPNVEGYKYYGARGIEICDRWLNSFDNFLADMGPRPWGLTIDRYPDADGDYRPGNCRWATNSQQVETQRRRQKASQLVSSPFYFRAAKWIWETLGVLVEESDLQTDYASVLIAAGATRERDIPSNLLVDTRSLVGAPPGARPTVDDRYSELNRSGMSLQEVGDAMGLTRERVRQIEGIALGKLRIAFEALERETPRYVAQFGNPSTCLPILCTKALFQVRKRRKPVRTRLLSRAARANEQDLLWALAELRDRGLVRQTKDGRWATPDARRKAG